MIKEKLLKKGIFLAQIEMFIKHLFSFFYVLNYINKIFLFGDIIRQNIFNVCYIMGMYFEGKEV